MTARLTVVHGNTDVLIEAYSTMDVALAAATVMENERHETVGKNLRELLPEWEFSIEGFQQFGTNYHYVTIEEEA